MTMSRRQRAAVVGVLAGIALLLLGQPAAAEVIIEVSAPQEAPVGEPVDITAAVRSAADGSPVEGAVVIFHADATFSGVSGEVELGRATTNSIGVATLQREFAVGRTHTIRAETLDVPGESAESASIAVLVTGEQLHTSETGLNIPGVGAWVVTVVIATVWGVMIGAAFWVVALARDRDDEDTIATAEPDELGVMAAELPPKRRSMLNLATIVTGTMIVIAVGLVVLLVRSPDTHANHKPEGYVRTPVAYVEASYLYPGLGPAQLAGDAVTDGRALFVSAGCAGCHGIEAQGTAAAGSPVGVTRDWLGQVVRAGLGGLMPAFSEAELTESDMDAIHVFLVRAAGQLPATTTTTAPAPSDTDTSDTTAPDDTTAAPGDQAVPTFTNDVLPIFQAECAGCHGSAGGWTATDYQSVLITGDNAPNVVVPGSVEDSLLAAKVTGTQTDGSQMPPASLLPEEQIAIITDWILGGAPE